jgi:hypothetical protein
MLGRSQKTLYGWEEHFNFPAALYHHVDDQRKKRWYSRRQLILIRSVYQTFGELKGPHRAKIHTFIAAEGETANQAQQTNATAILGRAGLLAQQVRSDGQTVAQNGDVNAAA